MQEPLWQEIYRIAWPCKIQVLPLSQEEFGEQLDTGFIEPNKIIKPSKRKALTTFQQHIAGNIEAFTFSLLFSTNASI